MKREEEIELAAKINYPTFTERRIGFIDGAYWADLHPQFYKGQTETMKDREVVFSDDWLKEHRGVKPTYADAIAWAEKRMIERTSQWLDENLRNYAPFYDVVDRSRFIDVLIDWMEE